MWGIKTFPISASLALSLLLLLNAFLMTTQEIQEREEEEGIEKNEEGIEKEEGEERPGYQIGRVIREVVFEDRLRGYRVRPAKPIGVFRPSPPLAPSMYGAPRFRPTPEFRPAPGFRPAHPRPRPRPSGRGRGRSMMRGGCNCVHLVSCNSMEYPGNLHGCSLPDGANGVCCPASPAIPPWGGITRLFNNQLPNVPVPPVSPGQLNQACHKGVSIMQDIQNLEHRLMRSDNVLQRGTPARGHLKFFQVTRTARSAHKGAMAISMASESMKREFKLTNEQGCIGLRQLSARNTILSPNCPAPPRCNQNRKYRSFDGTCNNLRRPLWGKSETSFQRILPAKYGDGIRSPRMHSVVGGTLPNERRISNNVLIDLDIPDPQFTLSVMQWGQFLDHDLAHTPFASFDNEEGKECCRNGQFVTPQLLEDCWPIELPLDDEFYGTRNQRCMNFVRSMIAEDDECSFGCAEQMNQVTHWLDGSAIYGSTEEEALAIRDMRTGLLIVSNGEQLPYQSERSHDCEANDGARCFNAGDSRVNEQPGLIAIHTLWHREHNKIARGLRSLNPQWSSEAIYQEARRIVLAEYQHIIYNEWLPIIVGRQFMRSFDIMPKETGYNLDYNPNINPNMNNEFATSAFRFGHTLVQGTMNLFSKRGRMSTLRLKDNFNSPNLFTRDHEMIDKFARTFSKQNIQRFDSFITKELTNHLFETKQTDFGMDLMSLNIHRGRDHAIATYNEIRVICGLNRAQQFKDLLDHIPEETVRRLSTVYRHVDDIDFFVGGISERPVAGGLLGWTFLCVIGDQFARLKKGDRFFYDLGGQPGSFKPDQLQELRKISWARILCDNSRMDTVQPLAFQLPSAFNPELPCHSPSIPTINLRLFQRERPHA